MTLRSHPNPVPSVRPSLEYLQKHVVKDPNFDHWFWQERKGKRTHDGASGQALVFWAVPATYKTDFVSRGRYNVARLFIEHLIGPPDPAVKIRSVCGLPQCVNPRHWGVQERVPKHRLAKTPTGWRVVVSRTGLAVGAAQVVRLRALDGIVHVARAAPNEPVSVLCDAPVDLATSVIVDAPVTCKGGC